MASILTRIVNLFGLSFILSSMNRIDQPKYITYVDEIVDQFKKQTKKDYNLICVGSGGSMPHDVQDILINMNLYQRVTMDEAAKIEIIATKKLKEHINSHILIRPFLGEYPFTTPRANINISFVDSDNVPHSDGSVAMISQFKNLINYFSFDSDNIKLTKIHQEPYEDAKKRLFPNGI